jgi:16S rRNA (uracil1498-N3)-methyltransferase
MPQFLITPEAIKGETATITGKDAHHITRVLRLKKGDWIVLTNGEGKRWRAEIVNASPKHVSAQLANLLTCQLANFGITLAQALIKHDRFEWIVQKAVELGCSHIVPFTSERTIPKFWSSALQGAPTSHDAQPKGCCSKIIRWQKIALEAAKQCGTAVRPTVEAPVPFARLIERLDRSGTNILFYEGETTVNLSTCKLANLPTVIIGPEGGFSLDEVAKAKEAGVATCGLGPLILRVETASIAAITLVQNKLGYFDKPPMNSGAMGECRPSAMLR